jgi:deoxyribodipyrimidine photo-lyase
MKVARQLPLHLIHGQTVFHPGEVLKADRTPYTVFTPYSKAWKAKLPSKLKIHPAPEHINTPAGIQDGTAPSFKVSPLFPAGEEEALVRLEEFLHSRIHAYGENRNRMDLEGTSSLSPYLHLGCSG